MSSSLLSSAGLQAIPDYIMYNNRSRPVVRDGVAVGRNGCYPSRDFPKSNDSFSPNVPKKRTGVDRLLRRMTWLCYLLPILCHGQTNAVSVSGYAVIAHYTPVANRAALQTELNTYKTIRLDPGADYTAGGVASLVIQSGQKIYGLPGTIVPPIVITPGTHAAVLSRLQTATVTFPASATSTHDNLFLSVQAKGVATGATLENNLFIDWVGAYAFDDSSSGYFRTNRFIRTHENGVDNPYLRLKGNSSTPSHGNVFLFYNFLTPHGDSTDLSGLTDLTFVGVDAESWSYDDLGSHAVITTASDVNTLRFFVANGGDGVHTSTDPAATGYFDIGGGTFLLYNDIADSAHQPKLLLESTVGSASLFGVYPQDFGTGFQQDNPATALFAANQDVSSVTPVVSSSANAIALRNAVLGTATVATGAVPWEAPVYDAVPDPGGSKWNANLASKKDSTAYIQGLIESQGIAFLPAGTYYISAPLRLKSTQGLIGAGMGSTLIIAKDPSIDMIIGDDHSTAFCSRGMLTLSDLTLEGGANGIHHDPAGSGPGAQYSSIYLSHVTFRNMSNAGIFVDSIVGWDNNMIDHVNFIDNATGILQRVSPTYPGGEANGESYLDKNLFYQCQFIANGIAVNLPAVRPDNLDIWADSLFSGNTNGAMQLAGNMSPVIANSDFVNNGGAAVLSDDGNNLNVVGSRFTAGALGQAIFGGSVSVEGSTFLEGAQGAASMLSKTAPGVTSFYNCISQDIPIGQIFSGYFFNNSLFGSADLSVEGLAIFKGVRTYVLPDSSATPPAPQLLLGQPLQIRY